MICSALITIAGLLQDKQAILDLCTPFAGSGHECVVFSAAFNSLNRCRASQVRFANYAVAGARFWPKIRLVMALSQHLVKGILNSCDAPRLS